VGLPRDKRDITVSDRQFQHLRDFCIGDCSDKIRSAEREKFSLTAERAQRRGVIDFFPLQRRVDWFIRSLIERDFRKRVSCLRPPEIRDKAW